MTFLYVIHFSVHCLHAFSSWRDNGF